MLCLGFSGPLVFPTDTVMLTNPPHPAATIMLRTAILAAVASTVSAQLPGDNGPVDCAAVLCPAPQKGLCYEEIEGECCLREVDCPSPCDEGVTFFPLSGECQDCRLVKCAEPKVGPNEDGFVYEKTGCCSSKAVGCVDGEFLPASDELNCVSPIAIPTCENPFPIVPAVCNPVPQCVPFPVCDEGELVDADGNCRPESDCIEPVEFVCPNQFITNVKCNTAEGEARCGDNEDCVEGFCCPQYTPYFCPNTLNVEGVKCNLTDGEARCGAGEECNEDGFCCPIVEECKPKLALCRADADCCSERCRNGRCRGN